MDLLLIPRCLVIATAVGLRIKEIPINWIHDKGSKIDILKQIAVMGVDLLLIWKKARSIQNTNNERVNYTTFSHSDDSMKMSHNEGKIYSTYRDSIRGN